MNYQFTIPQSFPQMTVKELLEDYFLIPRKIRHFLRTKKHVLVNGETINWQSPVQKGDQIQLIFDADDYPEKELPAGDPSLVEELYQDEHVIIVNKPEGMKTALHQSEKKRQKQIAKKTKVSLRMSKKRRRIWSIMRKKQSTRPISQEKRNTLGIPSKAGLVSNQKTIQRNF